MLSSLKNQMFHLTSLIQKLVVGNVQVKACGTCAAISHSIDMCPTPREESCKHAKQLKDFQVHYKKIETTCFDVFYIEIENFFFLFFIFAEIDGFCLLGMDGSVKKKQTKIISDQEWRKIELGME